MTNAQTKTANRRILGFVLAGGGALVLLLVFIQIDRHVSKHDQWAEDVDAAISTSQTAIKDLQAEGLLKIDHTNTDTRTYIVLSQHWEQMPAIDQRALAEVAWFDSNPSMKIGITIPIQIVSSSNQQLASVDERGSVTLHATGLASEDVTYPPAGAR